MRITVIVELAGITDVSRMQCKSGSKIHKINRYIGYKKLKPSQYILQKAGAWGDKILQKVEFQCRLDRKSLGIFVKETRTYLLF